MYGLEAFNIDQNKNDETAAVKEDGENLVIFELMTNVNDKEEIGLCEEIAHVLPLYFFCRTSSLDEYVFPSLLACRRESRSTAQQYVGAVSYTHLTLPTTPYV